MTSPIPIPIPPVARTARPATAALLGLLLLGGCVPVDRYASTSAVDPTAERRAAESPAALDRIGAAALRSGDPATAGSFFGRALALDPADGTAALGVAQAAARSGRPDDAIAALRDAALRARGDDRAGLDAALGRLLVLAHRPADAESVFRDGLRVAPGSPKLLTGLGVALDGQRRYPEAEASFRQALVRAPDDLPARNDLALSTALGGDPGTALGMLRGLRADAFGLGADENAIRTVDGNIALVQAMRGDVAGAQNTDAGAATDREDPARNAAFYSALAGTAASGS